MKISCGWVIQSAKQMLQQYTDYFTKAQVLLGRVLS